MRGFRGSRSAQNAFNSRFGRDSSHLSQTPGQPSFHPNDQQVKGPTLPDWLKTPETKAKEALQVQVKVQPPEIQPEPVKPKLVRVRKSTPAKTPRRPRGAASTKPVRKTTKKKVTGRRKTA